MSYLQECSKSQDPFSCNLGLGLSRDANLNSFVPALGNSSVDEDGGIVSNTRISRPYFSFTLNNLA